MSLTPRQLAAYCEFNTRIDGMEHAVALEIAALGAQGKSEEIVKTVRIWRDGIQGYD